MPQESFGRYETLAEIGRGAMGVVYKAADPVLNRIVAIKTINLSSDLEERKEYEARFYQEAKAVGSLSHPSIVTIYDLGNTGDVAYMAMEFLDGQELRNLIVAGNGMPVKQALAIIAQVADGLSYAHHRNIVHRDIKPANIMVLKDGTAKITDFGIARMRVSDVKTQTGIRLGSPKYMSPEQVLGVAVDHRSDIFSLGIVLYEALTGRTPFAASNVDALMYQTINSTPLPASRINPNVPEMLDLIIARTLDKKPEGRYQDASELVADLRECERLYGNGGANVSAAGLYTPPSGLSAMEHEKTVLLSPRAAENEERDGSDTRSISMLFDSFEATQRLAKEVGMTQAFDELSSTLRLSRTGGGTLAPDPETTPEAEHAWVVAQAPGASWSRTEKYFTGATLAISFVLAGLILLY